MRLMRLPATEEKVGLKKTEIYKQIDEGTFPAPIRVGVRQVAWLESELDEWIEAKVAARHTHEPLRPGTPRGSKRAQVTA